MSPLASGSSLGSTTGSCLTLASLPFLPFLGFLTGFSAGLTASASSSLAAHGFVSWVENFDVANEDGHTSRPLALARRTFGRALDRRRRLAARIVAGRIVAGRDELVADNGPLVAGVLGSLEVRDARDFLPVGLQE